MLYKNNDQKELPISLFKNPSSEYRGAPFWAWNCALTKEVLGEQIDAFKKMGFGGFHMHPRTGLDTPYLGKEYMEMVRFCVDKAKKENMLAYLYDEDRWPSGAAGGLVTKDKEYRARFLRLTSVSYDESAKAESPDNAGAKTKKHSDGRLLCCYDVLLDNNDCLKSYKVIKENEDAVNRKLYAYLELASESPWYNNQTYVNTLQKKAIDRFIDITHNAYKKEIKDEFGKTVPSIFTDEPQFSHKTTLNFPSEEKDVILPWSDDFENTYFSTYGESILEKLPEIIWELPNKKISEARYHYHDHITERFTEAFADNCGKWCAENGLMLTGHMMEEPTLQSQTAALGEAMRAYRSFGLPGIDMLCNRFEFTTAKQAQSASRQFGRPGVLSELYGVTGWHFDFRGHKIQGDWQAVLGITTRVPHLALVSMAGEAKRDYPASINYQSPWYKEYKYIEDHYARVYTAMTRGKAVVRVGVIHPIESYWLHWGPASQTKLMRDQMDENFQNITNWLLLGCIDFDFICESLLPSQCEKASCPLNIGKMSYDTVIVPGCEMLRSTTFQRLIDFKNNGGRIIFMGSAPKYLDAKESNLPKKLWESCEHIPFDRADILDALQNTREVEIRDNRGTLTDNLIYQLRQDNYCRWLFIAHGKNPVRTDNTDHQQIRIILSGKWNAELYDTLSGEISSLSTNICKGKTIIERDFCNHDSILLRLSPVGTGIAAKRQRIQNAPVFSLQRAVQEVPITLEEPNVLLLDYAEFAADDEPYEPSEEILRADNILRDRLKLTKRNGGVAQPWTMPKEEPKHTIRLKFTFESEIKADNAVLAVEDAEKTGIVFNGNAVTNKITGHYVDRAIKTVPLGTIIKGKNVLELTAPYCSSSNPEWCYILGDFGVSVKGTEKTVTSPVKNLGFGDITSQGLPFYGGNIIYHMPVGTDGFTKMKISVPHYRGALVGVYDGKKTLGRIVFAPYELISDIPAGGFADIKLFGNRANTFGPIHWCEDANSWVGPGSWRTTGDKWSDCYRLYETGILSAPVIELA